MDDSFNPEETLLHHLGQAQRHAQDALNLLYKPGGPKRSVFYKMVVGRAQNILMSLYIRETTEKGRRDREQRSTEHGDHLQS